MTTVQLAAVAPTNRLRRSAPVAGALAVGAAAVAVAANDPAAPGSHFPACAFHSATGLWCPGCGLTRGVHALLTGHVGSALSSNVFTPVAVVAVVWALLSWFRVAWDRPALRLRLAPRAQHVLFVTGTVAVLGYGLLRNIPVAPFRALAP